METKSKGRGRLIHRGATQAASYATKNEDQGRARTAQAD
jgi:hypothetical protein